MPDHTTNNPSRVKTCTKCGESKPLTEFHVQRANRDGLRSYCNACKSVQARAWNAANRERKAETNRAWYEANRERVAKTSRAYYAANREREAESRRAWYKANREDRIERANAWKRANPDKVAEYAVRERVKHPDRYAARAAVGIAVRRGDFPPASALVCEHCQEAQAEQWHHHLGYEPEHALDVIAVCVPCHAELDWGLW